ncbi:MAG TPA: amidohydrolase family protein [Candidatus Pacearchaeota archaeon]|nr:amidohydrolase family protein [Candidatus Pacearchaeota archaeon]
MIIDVHTHICNEQTYQDYKKKAKDKVGTIFIIPLPQEKLEKEFIEFSKLHEDLRVIGCISMNSRLKEQLVTHEKYFNEKEIYGIKLFPGYEHFYPYDEKVYPVAELCLKYGKPLIFHSGDTAGFIPDTRLKFIDPIHIDELAYKFPDLKIVISHFGFPYLLDTAMVMAKNKNVYSDISGTIDVGGGIVRQYVEDLQRVFAYYPGAQEKLMFGTDYVGEHVELDMVQEYIKCAEAAVAKKYQEAVFFETAQKVYFN